VRLPVPVVEVVSLTLSARIMDIRQYE